MKYKITAVSEDNELAELEFDSERGSVDFTYSISNSFLTQALFDDCADAIESAINPSRYKYRNTLH